jgi:2-dehydro-3-deoxygalactonokinase
MSAAGDIIGIDWGSTSLSAYRIGRDGTLLDHETIGAGVTRVDRAGIVATLAALVERWPGTSAIYASGMIGSTAGWCVAPYLDCPCTVAGLVAALLPVKIGEVECLVVPGLACRDAQGRPDVMRGEEVEAIGVALSAPDAAEDCVIVLPGTHTKWVELAGQEIRAFFSAMSGELYDVLSRHSLVGAAMGEDGYHAQAFADGVGDGASEAVGIARLLFGVRAQVLRGYRGRDHAASYLRGLLIGAEIADALIRFPHTPTAEITLLGNPTLCERYVTALAQLGMAGRPLPKEPVMASAYLALHRLRGDQ